jgi:hypothetical protein
LKIATGLSKKNKYILKFFYFEALLLLACFFASQAEGYKKPSLLAALAKLVACEASKACKKASLPIKKKGGLGG